MSLTENCYLCKLIKIFRKRKRLTILRRPVPCSNCGQIGFYAPPDKTTTLDSSIVCSKCIGKLSKQYFCNGCKQFKEWLVGLFPPYKEAICMDCSRIKIQELIQ